jgi:hypothetical protein
MHQFFLAYAPAFRVCASKFEPTPNRENTRHLHLREVFTRIVCQTLVIFPHLESIVADALKWFKRKC